MAKKGKSAPPAGAEGKPSGNKIKLIIIILVPLILLLGGGAAAYFVFFKPPPAATDGEEAAEAAEATHTAPDAHAPPAASAPLIYHELQPLTVNIAAPGPVRYLRVNLTLATHDQAVIDAVNRHLPRVRNDLLASLGAQDYAQLVTPEGKDALREKLKVLIIEALTSAGEAAGLDQLLFTELVMQ